MIRVLLIFSLLLTTALKAQNPNLPNKYRIVSGIVLSNGYPLKDVNVKVLDSETSTITNERGFYAINVQPGDRVSFTYTGLKDVKIIIEDVTMTLNLDMSSDLNQLNEVFVKGEKEKRRIIIGVNFIQILILSVLVFRLLLLMVMTYQLSTQIYSQHLLAR
ncbi:carboxypeptidase-like regulatory domain-containing protein [Croceiramulus getboli]|nr:carboxypeptidase-like regulatory domain-containing protein [Flavobacteriaceae bacterium YJPT1-3]